MEIQESRKNYIGRIERIVFELHRTTDDITPITLITTYQEKDELAKTKTKKFKSKKLAYLFMLAVIKSKE